MGITISAVQCTAIIRINPYSFQRQSIGLGTLLWAFLPRIEQSPYAQHAYLVQCGGDLLTGVSAPEPAERVNSAGIPIDREKLG